MSNNETGRTITAEAEEPVDPSQLKRLPFKELLKRVGPGMILTGVVIGPGSITTAAVLGSTYGYQLMWLLIPIFVMGTAFVLTNYRVAMLAGKPVLQVIHDHYGRTVTVIVGAATFLSGAAFTISNFTGTGIGMTLIFRIPWQAGACIMGLVCLLVIFYRGGVYKILEKAITACVFLMIICFGITVIASGGPKWGEFAKGFFIPSVPKGSLPAALAFISTSATVTTGLYGTYLGREKKWKKADLFNGATTTDSMAHVFSVTLITVLMLLTSAIVLYPKGVIVRSPTELAEQLRPVLGNFAPIIMGLSMLGAAFSSLLGTSQRTAVLMLDSLGKPCGLDNMSTKIFSSCVLAFGAIVAFIFGRQPIQLVIVAQVCTSVATPVAGLFLTLLLFSKKLNQGYKRPTALIVFMVLSYLFALGLTLNTVIGLLRR
ncbi:Nramp family divalent metal transporter [Breznakiella homolactica]|uniref:Nramp family divalent metal transporter n=1 Tax=Breznakiella homolactica TaxID=2798577 RepID=A0A7T7XMN9_9SPIR|nr:Nramp family divalent metal transporter [Breznakiella homolactica]QQO09102.1 Nramp family divalent metal transporter [Breznakiella homolactica]